MADFQTKALAALALNDIMGSEVNRPLQWTKLRLLLAEMAEDVNFGLGTAPQTIDMANAALTLVSAANVAAGERRVTSTTLLVDANGGSQNLTFAATCPRGTYIIVNTGGENIVVKNAAASTIGTIATAKSGMFAFDGTTLTSVGIALA